MLAFALEHEFRPSSFAVVRLEDLNQIANLKADLIACYKPVNSQELIAIERIALSQQAIFRGYRLEAGLFTSAFNSAVDPEDGRPIQPMHRHTVGDGDIEITRAQNRNYALAEGFRRVARESNALGLVMRYQVQAERQYRRAIEEFERLKRLRPELPNKPDLQTERDSSEDIAPLSELNPFCEDPVAQALSPVQIAQPAPHVNIAPPLPPVSVSQPSTEPLQHNLPREVVSVVARPSSSSRKAARGRPRHPPPASQ